MHIVWIRWWLKNRTVVPLAVCNGLSKVCEESVFHFRACLVLDGMYVVSKYG